MVLLEEEIVQHVGLVVLLEQLQVLEVLQVLVVQVVMVVLQQLLPFHTDYLEATLQVTPLEEAVVADLEKHKMVISKI